MVCKLLPESHIWPASFGVHLKAKDGIFILNDRGKIVLIVKNCAKFNFVTINQVVLEYNHTVNLCSILRYYWVMRATKLLLGACDGKIFTFWTFSSPWGRARVCSTIGQL